LSIWQVYARKPDPDHPVSSPTCRRTSRRSARPAVAKARVGAIAAALPQRMAHSENHRPAGGAIRCV